MILVKIDTKLQNLNSNFFDTQISCDINFKEINRLHSENIEESIEKLLSFHPTLKGLNEIQNLKIRAW